MCEQREESLPFNRDATDRSCLLVTQVQVTLASVQELLTQQQQKVQELAQELAAAKVLVPDPLAPPAPPARLCTLVLCAQFTAFSEV